MTQFKNMEKYYHARERGINWLLSQVKPDGSLGLEPPSLRAHFKIPYALVVSGHPLVARRVLDYLDRTFLTFEGHYEIPADDAPGQVFAKHIYIFPDCWIAEAAQRMGRFDIAQRTGRFILTFQDKDTGGFRTLPSGDLTDTLSTARAGMLCLFLGLLPRATQAGDFLLDAVDRQRAADGPIPVAFSPSGGPAAPPQGEDQSFYLIDTSKKDQRYYYLGFPMAFLTRLYQATGEQRYLEGAQTLFALHKKCAEDVFSACGSGPSGWGAAMLHTITGEDEYGRAAETLADLLLHTQSPEGFWFLSRVFSRVADQPPAMTYNATALHVILLSSILQEIP